MKRTLKFAVCVLACLLCLGLLLKADMPQVSTGTWAPAGSMTQARTGASAALLQDGRILITGGQSADGPSASAELVNHDGSFSAAARMHIARSNHISVVLHDGRVLVAGGTTTGGRTTSSAEIYDPVSNVWSAATSMVEPRSGQTASLLEDGRVLVAGGETVGLLGPSVSASLEIFDPTTNVFVIAGVLSTARKGHGSASGRRTRADRGRLRRCWNSRFGGHLRPRHGARVPGPELDVATNRAVRYHTA